jgi:hypothetical protein
MFPLGELLCDMRRSSALCLAARLLFGVCLGEPRCDLKPEFGQVPCVFSSGCGICLVDVTSCDLKLEFSQVPGVFIAVVGSCRKSAWQLVAEGCASLTGCLDR